MSYSEDDRDYIISANNKLSDYDKSVINTYFMDNGCSRYDDYKGTAWKIRNIIGEYLKINQKKYSTIRNRIRRKRNTSW